MRGLWARQGCNGPAAALVLQRCTVGCMMVMGRIPCARMPVCCWSFNVGTKPGELSARVAREVWWRAGGFLFRGWGLARGFQLTSPLCACRRGFRLRCTNGAMVEGQAACVLLPWHGSGGWCPFSGVAVGAGSAQRVPCWSGLRTPFPVLWFTWAVIVWASTSGAWAEFDQWCFPPIHA